MILDNSGMHYAPMLLFVFGFLVYWKISPNSRASGNNWLTMWLQSGHVNVVKKTMWRQRKQFLRFYCFKYLGSQVAADWGFDRDVVHRMNEGGHSTAPGLGVDQVESDQYVFSSLILIFHQYSVSKIHIYHAILQDSIRRHPGMEFNCYGLGSSREYVAELVKQYDLVALQETWLFPWDLAVPSTLGVDVNSFSLSSIDVTNGIKAGRPYGGITFIRHRYFGCNIQVKRYESDSILGLSVTINGSTILFINVYFPVTCHEKCEEYCIMCLGILVPYLSLKRRIMYVYWETLMQHQVRRDLMKFVTCYMRIV